MKYYFSMQYKIYRNMQKIQFFRILITFKLNTIKYNINNVKYTAIKIIFVSIFKTIKETNKRELFNYLYVYDCLKHKIN